jgi:hypothetical protein
MAMPLKDSSPYYVESIFDGEALVASPIDEFTCDIKGFVVPWFEPFTVMQDKRLIFVRGEFSVDIWFSHLPVRNALSQSSSSSQLVARDLWPWLLTASSIPNT